MTPDPADSTVLRHGPLPYRVVLVHGGPGAPGTMGPLARLLAPRVSCLEPHQQALSIDELVAELQEVVSGQAQAPVVVVGASWGAMLAVLHAAEHPTSVARLILVGSACFEEGPAASILPTRLGRLEAAGRARAEALLAEFRESNAPAEETLAELGEIFHRTDSFDPLTDETGLTRVNLAQHQAVWSEACALRSSGELLARAARIPCEVVAIHGTHDPHPVAGIEPPLRRHLSRFRWIPLERCGHVPWLERQARERFLSILLAEIEAALEGPGPPPA